MMMMFMLVREILNRMLIYIIMIMAMVVTWEQIGALWLCTWDLPTWR